MSEFPGGEWPHSLPPPQLSEPAGSASSDLAAGQANITYSYLTTMLQIMQSPTILKWSMGQRVDAAMVFPVLTKHKRG
jgi:hypothetical protein